MPLGLHKFLDGITGYGWINAGTQRDTNSNNWGSFIQNAGGGNTYADNSEAVLLFLSTGSTYTLETNIPMRVSTSGTIETTVFKPSDLDVNSYWGKNLKWLVTDADNLLGTNTNATAFITIWDDNLQINSANGSIPHAILGSRYIVDHKPSTMTTILNAFFSTASSTDIADAWVVNGGSQDANKSLAALIRYDNKDDLLTTPTPDSADKTMLYMYLDSFGTQHSTTYTAWNIPLQNPLSRVVQFASLNLHFLPKLLPVIVQASPEQIQWNKIDSHLFTKINSDGKGYTRLGRNSPLVNGVIQLDNQTAESMAKNIIDTQAGGFPSEAHLNSVNDVRVGSFISGKLHETYKEHTKAKLVEFYHVHNGKQITVNGRPDVIHVVIDVDGVQLVERNWHNIIGE